MKDCKWPKQTMRVGSSVLTSPCFSFIFRFSEQTRPSSAVKQLHVSRSSLRGSRRSLLRSLDLAPTGAPPFQALRAGTPPRCCGPAATRRAVAGFSCYAASFVRRFPVTLPHVLGADGTLNRALRRWTASATHAQTNAKSR